MHGNNITYRQQNSFCSKPGCRKCREGIGHGPYWYAYQVVNGRSVRTYIGKTLPPGTLPQDAQAEQAHVTPAPVSPVPSSSLAFRLTTLGQTRLESHSDGERWQLVADAGWRLPDARVLLCCLAGAPKRHLTQQQACDLLWPELDAKIAIQHLRRASTALSQMLGPSCIKLANNTLMLADQERFWIDFEAFENLLAQERSLAATRKHMSIGLLEQALKLYGGDFLSEERSARWPQERRKGLRRQWISGMLELVDFYLDEQRSGSALELLDQLLAIDPINEAVVQRLMFVLARQQRRVEAVQAYQHLAHLLRNTYHAAPSPETQALFQAVQQGHEALFRPLFAAASKPGEASSNSKEAEVREQPENPEPVEHNIPIGDSAQKRADSQETEPPAGIDGITPEIYTGRTNQSPLVGRDLELSSLHQMLAQIDSMRGQQTPETGSARALLREVRKTPRAHCVVLRGEAGIGKTRLAEESAREARRRGWTVIWSRAYQQEQGIPYRLWTAALRNVLTYIPDLARQATAFASAATYQPLRALVPEMQETLVGAGVKNGLENVVYESLSPEQEELRLRDAVYTFLATLSFTAPLLIVLDDIQWTDESSAQMLGYLTRRMTDHPIALLATSRETELVANRVLHGLIAHMQREQVVEILPVQPLSDEQIGALVSYLPVPAIIQVQSQAAGNPFFAEELAYSLQTSTVPEARLQAIHQEETQFMPGTIAAALDQRLNRLSKECQDLLGKAAVLGGSFDFELIATMEAGNLAGDDDAVLDLLDEALHAGVLTEEGGGARVTYHFWHPLLASHLYNGLSATRRARLHRRVAEALPQVHPTQKNEEAATITQHLIKGGADAARIAHYAELAANHAYSLFAYPEAERYYRIALKYLAPTMLDPELPTVSEQPLLPGMSPDQRRYLALLVERLADCTRIVGNFQETRNFYMRVLQIHTNLPRTFATPAEERQEAQIQAMLWNEIAWVWRYNGDTAAARNCNAQGEEVLRAAGITDGPAWGCLKHQRASLYWQEGYHQEALQAAEEALALFTACLAQSALSPGQAAPGNVPANRQTRITRTVQGDPADLGRVQNFLGIIYNAIGQLSEALKHLQEALAINDRYDRRREGANVCCNIGHVYLLKAEYQQAQPFFERALSYAERSGDIPIKSVTLHNLGEQASAAGQLEEAEKFHRESLALVAQMNDREYMSMWRVSLGELLQEQKRFKEAASVILRALSIGRAMSNRPCIGVALVALANLRMTLVEDAQASSSKQGQRALRHAEADLHRALGLRGLDAEKRTRAQLALARVSFLAGDFAHARQLGQQACAEAKKYELQAILVRCQRLLALLPEV